MLGIATTVVITVFKIPALLTGLDHRGPGWAAVLPRLLRY
jgi:hypothetical protein